MFAASWFHWSKGALTTVVSKSIRRNPFRRPTHSPPSLEWLEERVVPDAASNNMPGVINNTSTVTASSTQQNSFVLAPTLTTAQLNGFAVGAFPTAGSLTMVSLSVGVFAAFPVTNQFYAQLNGLGINTLGQQGLGFSNSLPNFFQTVYGFGSGTQPAQPWVPNAYNLGLANQQAAYPTMADQGFQAPGSWRIRPIAHLQEENVDANPLDKQPVPPRIFVAAKESAEDDNPADKISADEDADAIFEEPLESDTRAEAWLIPLVAYPGMEREDVEAAAVRSSTAPNLDSGLFD
jgi:hypothetical protein